MACQCCVHFNTQTYCPCTQLPRQASACSSDHGRCLFSFPFVDLVCFSFLHGADASLGQTGMGYSHYQRVAARGQGNGGIRERGEKRPHSLLADRNTGGNQRILALEVHSTPETKLEKTVAGGAVLFSNPNGSHQTRNNPPGSCLQTSVWLAQHDSWYGLECYCCMRRLHRTEPVF